MKDRILLFWIAFIFILLPTLFLLISIYFCSELDIIVTLSGSFFWICGWIILYYIIGGNNEHIKKEKDRETDRDNRAE